MDISVVIPVYNEEKNIQPLYNKLKPVMDSLNKEYEIVFVDDGCIDKTFQTLERLHRKDERVRVIKFRKNFGQTAALGSGFEHSRGKVVISMDGDLQNDPQDIPKVLKRLEEGYDVVSGWRYERKDSFLTKILPSKFSNWLAMKLTGLNIHDFGCSLKAYTADSLRGIKLYGEMHRYIPALVAMNGFKVTEVKVKHHPRKYGETKYGLMRLLKGFLDLLYIKFWSDYSTRPLHFFGLLGVILVLLGSFIGFYKVMISFLYFGLPLIAGPLLLLSVLVIIIGLQFITFGFLVEIQVRIYYDLSEDRKSKIEGILE